MKQIIFRAPDHLVAELDKLIDGHRFQSRSQLLIILICEWLATKKASFSSYEAALYYNHDSWGSYLYERELEEKRKKIVEELLRGPDGEQNPQEQATKPPEKRRSGRPRKSKLKTGV